MDPILLLKALILGIVEGLTEFLPISSTGHLILAGDLLDFNDDRGKLFEIVIQSGAILAVVWEYRERLLTVARGAFSDKAAQKFILNLFIAFLPLAILGLAFGKAIKANLFNPIAVATTFILGAFVILWAERRDHRIRIQSVDEMSMLDALKMGIAQAFALIPGTSRSGATIIGGLLYIWAFGAGAGERAQALDTLAAPDFELPDFDGKTHRLSDYRGQKVFLATWASW